MRSLVRRALRIALLLLGVEVVGLAGLYLFDRLKRRPKRVFFPHRRRPPIRVGDHELTIFDFGEDAFRAMFEDIRLARDSILLETYIFRNDDVGNSFRKRLIRKAQRGVRVYIIFDAIGSFSLPAHFRRFPRNVRTFEFGPIKGFRTLLDHRRLLVRDHRKVLVTDGDVAYLGGINIGKEYSRRWRDTHLRIAGPVAKNVARTFEQVWEAYKPHQPVPLDFAQVDDPRITIRANDPVRRSFPIHDCYLEAFNNAKRHIRIANSYFLPPRSLIDALCAAADRGVRVEILLPEDSDVVILDWAARNLFSELLSHGIRIWLYKKTVNHSKTCTIDGEWSTIGSANLDPVSLYGNFEINAFVRDEAFAAEMEAMWDNDLLNCERLDPLAWEERPVTERLAEVLTRPLIPYL